MSPAATRPSTPAAAAAASARFAERIALRKRSRWVKAGIGIVVALALIVGTWVVCFSDVFAVRAVQVAGVDRLSSKQVEQVARVPRGGSLALLDTASIAARVRTLIPVADVDVSRKFPNTVRIKVTERKAVAVLDTPQGRKLVDAAGVVFAPAGNAPANLTLVVTRKDTLPPDALVEINEMLAALPEDVRGEVRRVDADTDQDMSMLLRDGRRVVWGGPDQAAFKARVLELLYTDKATRKARAYDVSVPEAPVTRK